MLPLKIFFLSSFRLRPEEPHCFLVQMCRRVKCVCRAQGVSAAEREGFGAIWCNYTACSAKLHMSDLHTTSAKWQRESEIYV